MHAHRPRFLNFASAMLSHSDLTHDFTRLLTRLNLSFFFDLVIVPASYYYFGGHATPTMLFLLRGNAPLFGCGGGIPLASRQATLHSQHPGSSELVTLPTYDPAVFFACLPISEQ
jgi:hypothetical protein